MEVLVENTSTLGRRIKISVPDITVSEQIKSKMGKLAREAHLKGFRPGKVPLSVLEKKFGSSVRLEVIEEIIRQSLTNVFEEKSLQVAGSPKIEEVKDQSGEGLEFVAQLEVYPEITLASLADIEIEKRQVTLEDADVDTMMEKLKTELADWTTVSREVKSGDKLKVDFARHFSGEDNSQKEEQKAVEMIVGAEGVLPGLTEALLGRTQGETVELNTAYPAEWAEARVAGKPVTLWVTIQEIAQQESLSVAALAEKLGVEQENITAEVKKRMQEEVELALREELKEKVLENLLEKNPIELPQALIEQEKEAIRTELSRQRKVNLPKEAMHAAEWEEQAKRRVELGLLLNEVIKKYDIKADPIKIRAEIEKIAARFPAHAAQVMEAYYQNKDMLHSVERMLLLEEAVNVMLGEMKQKEVSVTFDQVMNPKNSEQQS